MGNDDKDKPFGLDVDGSEVNPVVPVDGEQCDDGIGEHELALLQRASAMAALRNRPGLETLNEGLGEIIGNLSYDEYRQFAGIIMKLRIEENADYGHVIDRNVPLVKTRMQTLLDFVENHPSENIRNMKNLLDERTKFNESDLMLQLVLLTRLYYKRGINMLNPTGDPEQSDSLRVREDKDISVRLGEACNLILYVGKLNGKITVTYHDEFEWSQMYIEDGKTYVFGRIRGSFTVSNCKKALEDVFGRESLVEVPGLMERYISRAGIAIECHGDDISFFDRASKNTLSFAWEKFSSEGQPIARKSGISMYDSVPIEDSDGSVSLGSSVVLSDDGSDDES